MKKTPLKYTVLILLAAVAALALSCGSAGLPAPSGLQAEPPDPDNPGRIEINWLPVEGAGIYYVYRDETETGAFETGAGQSVTASEDAAGNLRYRFIDSLEEDEYGTYYYKVTAAPDLDISQESPKSGAVAASTYSGSWSAASSSVVASSAGVLSLAAATDALYAVYTESAGSGVIRARKYSVPENAEAGSTERIWTDITGSAGTVKTGGDFVSALIYNGSLAVVYASASGEDLSLSILNDAWTAAGTSDQSIDVGPSAAVAGTIGQTLYAGFIDTNLYLYEYKNVSDTWAEITLPAINPVSRMDVIIFDNDVYLGYTDPSDDGYLKIVVPDSPAGVLASELNTDNFMFVPGGGDLYAVYIKAAGLGALKYDGSTWSDLTDVAGDSEPAPNTASPSGALAACWFNSMLYVMYTDSASRLHIRYYDEDKGWQPAQRNGGAVDTAGVYSSFSLVPSGNTLYAGYVKDDSAYVRVLK